MRVTELIDILSDYPPDADVVVSVVAPVTEPGGDETTEILIDHYDLAGIHMPETGRDLVLLITGDDDDGVNSENVAAASTSLTASGDIRGLENHASRGLMSVGWTSTASGSLTSPEMARASAMRSSAVAMRSSVTIPQLLR